MGRMIWQAIKNAATDIWDEVLFLMIFNVIWIVGTLFIIAWPFVTFSLYHIVYDVGQGKGIKFGKFFNYGRQTWKQAYIWGIINIVIIVVILVNFNFYGSFGAQWASLVQILILGVAIFWFGLQLVALPLYPRLAEPGFRLAVRNAAILMGKYPLVILTLMALVTVLLVLAFYFQAMAFIGIFAIIAVLTNRMAEAMIKRELGQEGATEESDMSDDGFNLGE